MSPEGLPITSELRSKASNLALTATILLTVIKLLTAYISGSASLLSEGVHSLMDLFSALLTAFTVRESIKPADEEHPFGHGKMETVSSLFEGCLLIGAAFFIFSEAVSHLQTPQAITHQPLAIGVLLFSLAINWFVFQYNLAASKTANSSALKVNAFHFLSDVLSSLAVLVGLITIYFTQLYIVDSIMCAIVGCIILIIAIPQVKTAITELIDNKLPEEDILLIKNIILNHKKNFFQFHNLKTRKSGFNKHINFTLTVCGMMSVNEAHQLCHTVENDLLKEVPESFISIQIEPCKKITPNCSIDCRELHLQN